jgi:hypothetical protein
MAHVMPAPGVVAAPIPLRELRPWAIFGGLLGLLVIYFVGAEQGALSVFSGQSAIDWRA